MHIPSTKNPDFDKLLKTDVDFARKIAKLALRDLQLHLHNNKSSIIYGTNEGSIGQLFKIPAKVYVLLSQLQQAMDLIINCDIMQTRRQEFRTIKSSITSTQEFLASKNPSLHSSSIIDGDFVEVFIQQPKQKQLEIIRKFSASQSVKYGDEFFNNDLL